jgi:hypothetical protein
MFVRAPNADDNSIGTIAQRSQNGYMAVMHRLPSCYHPDPFPSNSTALIYT